MVTDQTSIIQAIAQATVKAAKVAVQAMTAVLGESYFWD